MLGLLEVEPGEVEPGPVEPGVPEVPIPPPDSGRPIVNPDGTLHTTHDTGRVRVHRSASDDCCEEGISPLGACCVPLDWPNCEEWECVDDVTCDWCLERHGICFPYDPTVPERCNEIECPACVDCNPCMPDTSPRALTLSISGMVGACGCINFGHQSADYEGWPFNGIFTLRRFDHLVWCQYGLNVTGLRTRTTSYPDDQDCRGHFQILEHRQMRTVVDCYAIRHVTEVWMWEIHFYLAMMDHAGLSVVRAEPQHIITDIPTTELIDCRQDMPFPLVFENTNIQDCRENSVAYPHLAGGVAVIDALY